MRLFRNSFAYLKSFRLFVSRIRSKSNRITSTIQQPPFFIPKGSRSLKHAIFYTNNLKKSIVFLIIYYIFYARIHKKLIIRGKNEL